MPLILPIIWALVATVIALVLYRTSKTLFESDAIPNLFAKRIRLTGSIVIAGLAFLGMKWATPDEALQAATQENSVRSRQQVEMVVEATQSTEAALMELAACVEMSGTSGACSEQLRFSRENASRARARAEQLPK